MEINEQKYLKIVLKTIDAKLAECKQRAESLTAKLKEKMRYTKENFSELSRGGDLSAIGVQINETELLEHEAHNEVRKIERQKALPYFARVDFLANGTTNTQNIYIGIGNVTSGQKILVVDWRAPVSSLYYDYEIGKASFMASEKKIDGEITLKRQYKIENGQLINYFDSDVTVNDEILRDILSRNVSTKMKQIVSSIQKEQNQIVRKDVDENILVQGIAGSGKTSIALHRAAYLLYKYRKQIKSSDILILSPNNIFSSYISEVLPQLGEDNLTETTFADIVRNELKRQIQSRENMLDEIASHPTQKALNEISYKSSYEFLDSLLRFLKGAMLETFSPKTLSFVISEDIEGNTETMDFTDEETKTLFFKTFKGLDIHERINKIAWQYAMRFTKLRGYTKEQNRGLKERFKVLLYKFFPITDIDKIFEIFMAREGLSYSKNGKIGYMDKGTYMLIKHYFFGFDHDFSAKYLIIDEMQDFTPVDIYIFKKLWTCPCIIVGDINQCIEKSLPEEYLNLTSDFLGCKLIHLNKTYRSTKQIAMFASKIIGKNDVEFVNRNGEEPKIIQTQNQIDEIVRIINEECKSFEHIAIICKCNREAQQVYNALSKKINASLMKDAEDYNNRVLVATCASAKGIEFDAVIIPNASDENYNNSVDKNILYVSSTRALHKLFFLTDGLVSKLLQV